MCCKDALQIRQWFVPFIPGAAVEIEAAFVWFDTELDGAVCDVFILHGECASAGALSLAAPVSRA